MFGPDYTAGCPSCSAIADGFNGSVVHLENHDVTLVRRLAGAAAKLQAYKQRMGWTFPWASSSGSDFNFDFQSRSPRSSALGGRRVQLPPTDSAAGTTRNRPLSRNSRQRRHGLATYGSEDPGVSAFVLDDGVVYHTYSTYERGLDGIWGMYPWLDRAPHGRNETGIWWRRKDEYARA